jgi:uncharacterized protein YjbI with pentapeptide repeats
VADEEHLRRLKKGVDVWNAWRREEDNYTLSLDLRNASLSGADLQGVDLRYAFLKNANLTGANLSPTFLTGANLTGAKLSQADLSGADLSGANLRDAYLYKVELTVADLNHADLTLTNLREADLSHADLSKAILGDTIFGDVNFTGVIGLETCEHIGPSTIDHQTLQKSGHLPPVFLRGVGLPDNLIEYLPSLLNQAIQHYSCFISYSFKDQEFADRRYADLQNKGVRCWFAPHDLPIGGKILDEIDAAIRLRDKVVLILSRNSIKRA